MDTIIFILTTLVTSVLTAVIVLAMFRNLFEDIFTLIVGESRSRLWQRVFSFTLVVISVAFGAELGKFTTYAYAGFPQNNQTIAFWLSKVLDSAIDTLYGAGIILVVFGVGTLIAYTIKKRGEKAEEV